MGEKEDKLFTLSERFSFIVPLKHDFSRYIFKGKFTGSFVVKGTLPPSPEGWD